jgi:hypothetical protein
MFPSATRSEVDEQLPVVESVVDIADAPLIGNRKAAPPPMSRNNSNAKNEIRRGNVGL